MYLQLKDDVRSQVITMLSYSYSFAVSFGHVMLTITMTHTIKRELLLSKVLIRITNYHYSCCVNAIPTLPTICFTPSKYKVRLTQIRHNHVNIDTFKYCCIRNPK